MFDELIKRIENFKKVYKEKEGIIRNTGKTGVEAILKIREETPDIYKKYLNLCYEADNLYESLWEERIRLHDVIGIEYRKQPSIILEA